MRINQKAFLCMIQKDQRRRLKKFYSWRKMCIEFKMRINQKTNNYMRTLKNSSYIMIIYKINKLIMIMK